MKILVISYLFPNSLAPSLGIFVFNRLKHVNRYCKVVVINPIPWFPFSSKLERYKGFGEIPKVETIQGIKVYHPRFFIVPKYFKFIDAITFAAAVVPLALRLKKNGFAFDLIDLHWTYPDLLSGRLLSRLTRKKQLVTIRGEEALCLDERTIRSFLIKVLLRSCDYAISLSEDLKKKTCELGVPLDKARTIRNGVDTKAFQYKDKYECRKKLGLPENAYIVLSVGSLIFRKGFDRLVKSFNDLAKENSDALLYIVGAQGPEGDFRKELNQLIDDLSLRDRVRFAGLVGNDELVYWYNAADMFCLFSRGEGSPNVLSEALTCGCPSVATDVGAVSDILDRDFMGAVVPNSGSGITPLFLRAAGESYNRQKIGDYMKGFDWDWCAKKVVIIYKKLLNL